MAALIVLILASLLQTILSEYVPPGPTYPCPKESQSSLLYPCICTSGSDTGIHVRCENAGLAVLSVGLGNIAGLGLPIESLVLKECKFSHLFGPLFHRSKIRVINIIDTPVQSIDVYTFAGVNKTLQELYMHNTEIDVFPADAFKILSNLTALTIDGHKMTKLTKDIFAGSEAAGRLEKLRITNGLITEFPPETFQNLKKLKVLDLHGNRLVNLKRNQFKGLRDTEVLDISHNNITKLDGQHLGDLTKLGWCNVSHNQIGEISRGMFARNTVLKVLHLDHNKIKKLDTNSFKGMRFLRRLFLQDNQIADIGRGTFSAVTRIGTVHLARNHIQKVDFQMFQQVKYAELIDLAENKIKIIESQAFTDLYLAVVNISHNELTTIEKGSFQNCQNMTVLDFSHNLLEDITKGAFDVNSYAGELNLAYNKFTDFSQVPIANMSGIRIVNVSHNSISTIPRNSFPKLYELHTVDVAYNNLSEIYNAVFQNLFSIRYLNLSHNSLTTLKPSTFGSLPTVLHLDLSHNQLSDVAKSSLAKLASCRVLDVSYNNVERMFQIPISLGELNLSHNRLSSLPPSSFPSMNALLRLNLSHNGLQDSLQQHSFLNLVALNTLDLSGNDVTRPPWEALSVLSSLQYLYLQNNNLTALTRSAFGTLPTLFHLQLSHNNISTVAARSFSGLQQVSALMLDGNRLRRLEPGVFQGLVALRHLDLSHNNLDKIDNKTNGALDDCLSLDSINLSHNNFSSIHRASFPASPWIPYRLRAVDLSHNQLYVLTKDITVGMGRVEVLNLTGNHINDVRNNVLGNFTSLQVLDLSNNALKNLISRNSEEKFNLPANLTHFYLQNNLLEDLPLGNIINATKLRVLDLRNNGLTSFYPELVRKIEHNGLQVLFEGNPLTCNCLTRPLLHLLRHFTPSALSLQHIYTSLSCHSPPKLQGVYILEADEARFVCGEGGSSGVKGEGEFDRVAEPDLMFRDIQYSQEAIYVHWFVNSNQDVADFYVYMRNIKNELIYTNDVSYSLRSLTIAIDNAIKTSLQNNDQSDIDICVQAKTSVGFARKWHSSQCQKVPNDFSSWPAKLNVDKRRLTKKKVRYSWFGNSVMGLVSDSILLTLCIFLGVCFRKLNDFEL